MNISTIHILKVKRIFITDIIVLISVYFIPAFSHLTSFPLYMLDPMRILLFTGYLVSRNKKNAFILAATIPLFSMLVSGHPPFFKALLISMELFINIWLFSNLLEKSSWPVPVALFTSIIFSKLIYYLFKFIFISMTLLQVSLISTNLLTQLVVALFITIVFSLFFKKENNIRN